jgi:hypothetical protein
MLRISILMILSITSLLSRAQKPWELGGEYMRPMGKGYSGTMAGARYETYSNKLSWSAGATYNFTPGSKSYSVHKGFGLFAGMRYGFSYSGSGKGNAFGGVRVHFLFENYEGKANINGLSIMPVLEGGYHFIFKTHLFASPAVGGGYMFRITHLNNSLQEDEGGRLIPGVAAGYRF